MGVERGSVAVRTSADAFAALAKDLRSVRAGLMRKELYKGLSRAGRPLKPAVIESARAKLPGGGGRGRRARRLVRTGETLTNAVSGRTHDIKAWQRLSNRDGSAKLSSPGADSVASRVAASSFTLRVSNRASGASLRFTATERRGKKVDLASLERGRLRHPLFGNRKFWFDQPVPPGWFTKAIEAQASNVLAELDSAVENVLREIGRG